jgi:hypothetical protein
MKLSALQIAYIQSFGERVTASQIVADAKRLESPLHGEFNWDVQEAAERHWLDTARRIIRSVPLMVVTTTATIRAPYYVPDPDKKGNEEGYVSLPALGERPRASQIQALVNECDRVGRVLQRARGVAAGLGLEDEVEAVLERLAGLRLAIQDTLAA